MGPRVWEDARKTNEETEKIIQLVQPSRIFRLFCYLRVMPESQHQTHNIPYLMQKRKRLVYILRAYTYTISIRSAAAKRWRWQRIRKTPIKIMIILISGEFWLDSTQHRSAHTHSGHKYKCLRCDIARAFNQSRLRHYAEDSNFAGRKLSHITHHTRTSAMIPNLLFSRLACKNPDFQIARLEMVAKGRAFPCHWMARGDEKIECTFLWAIASIAYSARTIKFVLIALCALCAVDRTTELICQFFRFRADKCDSCARAWPFPVLI